MANSKNGGNGIPKWAELMLIRLDATIERHDTSIKLQMQELAVHKQELETSKRRLEKLEEELLKERAKTLLEQMKLQMGMATTAPEETPSKTLSKHAVPKRPSAETETPASEATEKPLPPVDRPEKTIGRMK